jgi:hypothetical protein
MFHKTLCKSYSFQDKWAAEGTFVLCYHITLKALDWFRSNLNPEILAYLSCPFYAICKRVQKPGLMDWGPRDDSKAHVLELSAYAYIFSCSRYVHTNLCNIMKSSSVNWNWSISLLVKLWNWNIHSVHQLSRCTCRLPENLFINGRNTVLLCSPWISLGVKLCIRCLLMSWCQVCNYVTFG